MSTPRQEGNARGLPDVGAPGSAAHSLADGGWHRMHPLTPLFKGGLVLVIVIGYLFANLRERLVYWLVSLFTPARVPQLSGDPVDWVLRNNLVLIVLLGIVVVLLLLIGIFWLMWRFHDFRITEAHVEVRKGVIFRSHRRAPLDRVQGVNLTRPFPARIIGLAKLEVDGAGNDANVPMEYLSTAKAESVRADILRLASGARQAREATRGSADPTVARTMRAQLADSMNAGVTGLITGVDLDDVAPEHVLRIPTGRLVGSHLLSGLVWVAFLAAVFGVAMAVIVPAMLAEGRPGAGLAVLGIALVIGIPMLFGALAVTWGRIARALRYSIAPTPDGVRITFGLFTTVTETIPPGRIFAVEVSQPLLWRPFGWWTVRINRMSGRNAARQQSNQTQQFNIVLPVGARADVERVLGLILPDAPAEVVPLIWEQGVLGPQDGDPYATIPPRAGWRRPLSWRRHGIALTDFALLIRRGRIWRQLAVFPLARLQGFSLHQGPIDRAQRVAKARAHSAVGPVRGDVSGIESATMLAMLDTLAPSAARAAAEDRAHRWAEGRETPAVAAPPGHDLPSGIGGAVDPAGLADPGDPARTGGSAAPDGSAAADGSAAPDGSVTSRDSAHPGSVVP
ncbi:PH domain-containing protein [Microbacterium sp. ASV81]|uniref:PH domain-containing protein n=1 Tax=Microbacterium capsulatum TaxID=3041921 RepID=A0ABU0XK34_9MICO|nr:PH domain-containing protein [Microbacterium sp. ASV81]MDQ4215182.1 PH domain-containing protein [Microbacterium sp. ASV81]